MAKFSLVTNGHVVGHGEISIEGNTLKLYNRVMLQSIQIELSDEEMEKLHDATAAKKEEE